jgi:hypothetical protein
LFDALSTDFGANLIVIPGIEEEQTHQVEGLIAVLLALIQVILAMPLVECFIIFITKSVTYLFESIVTIVPDHSVIISIR